MTQEFQLQAPEINYSCLVLLSVHAPKGTLFNRFPVKPSASLALFTAHPGQMDVGLAAES